MGVDLVVECFAERDCVLGSVVYGHRLITVVEPKMNLVKKVQTRPVGQATAFGVIVGAEEDGGCEDSLECLDDSVIVAAILGQMEKVEHLSSALEPNGTALLLDGERRYPDRDEAILAKGDVHDR